MSTDSRKSAKTAAALMGVVVLMVGASFAAVTFYDWFCRVTGYGGRTSTATSLPDAVLDQTIRIRFDASLQAGMPWEFKPEKPSVEIRIGEPGLAYYEAYNPTDRVMAGTASYNVAPDLAGYYFTKVDCFCFEMQVLQPGERVMMPVSYYVDPKMMEDAETKGIKAITLSYTFHETPLPEEQAALTTTEKSSTLQETN